MVQLQVYIRAREHAQPRRRLHIACADWSLLPIFLRHMPALAVLGVMALPQDAMRRDLF